MKNIKFTALNTPRQSATATPLIDGKISTIKIPIILFILEILIGVQTTYAAFTVKPQQLMLRVSEGERVGWVEFANTGNEPVAVELVMYERNLDLEGEAITDSMQKTEDFTIYPSQILLYPAQNAKAQIVLKGKERITADKAYFLSSKEVPFKFPREENPEQKTKVGVSMTISFQTIVALETGKQGSLSFVSSKALDSGRVELIVENKSGGRVATERLYIMVGDEKINDFTGKGNSIMPGQKRRFTFIRSKPVAQKEFKYGTE